MRNSPPGAESIARKCRGELPQVALASLGGNLLVQQLPQLPSPWWLCLAAMTCLLARRRCYGQWLAIGFFAAAWTCQVAAARLEQRLAPAASPADIELVGWVDSFPIVDRERAVFTLLIDSADHSQIAGRIRLSWYEPPPGIVAGAGLKLSVRLRSPRGLLNPDGFDYERWLFVEGLNATGYVRQGTVEPGLRFGVAQAWLKFRASIASRLADSMEGRAAALATALSIGERDGFSDTDWSTLRRTGTSHLVAISGMHVGLIAAAAFFLVLRVCLLLPYRLARQAWNIAAVLALAAAILYSALAGFALSTQRALLMLCVAEIVVISRRRIGRWQGYSVALLLVLLIDPLASLTVAFWLSFGAVAVILGRLPTPKGPPHGSGRLLRLARAGLLMAGLQWRITVGLMPLLLLFFSEVSLLSLPVNLFAIPFFSLIVVPLSLLAAAGALLGIDPGFDAIESLAGLTWSALDFVAGFDFAVIERPPPGSVPIGFALLGVCIWLFASGLRRRRWALLALLPLLIAPERRPAQGHFDVTVFDVGHGLSVLVETRRHRLLFDTGPVFRSGFDVGGEIVVPAIRRLSTQPLDTVIVSHADLDHSGGAAAVMRGHPAARLLAGPDFTDFGATACRRGEEWIWDGVKFAVLHPADDFLPGGNDSSCVLKIEAKDLSALLTGDIERRGEADLVDGVNFAADFVVVPHHGSATSSTAAFVRGTGARHAVVSAGYDNRWGFPRDEVRARWEAADAEIHVTGDSGALSFGSASPDRVGQLRLDRRRYWRAGIFPGT